jgi:hypothetical protein
MLASFDSDAKPGERQTCSHIQDDYILANWVKEMAASAVRNRGDSAAAFYLSFP